MVLSRSAFAGLCRARDLLAEARDPQLSIRDAAREAGMSPYHFIRRFEALFGVTPHQFRIAARLDRARLLLAAGGHSVTEVCFEVGFQSLGSFSDLFSRRVGSAPSEYRKHARTLVQAPGALPQELFPGCLSLMARLPAAAFRNFREAPIARIPLEFDHADQTHRHHGGEPG